MEVVGISSEVNEKRSTFFHLLFGQHKGYLCIAYRVVSTSMKTHGVFREDFFAYPEQLDLAIEHINKIHVGADIWFCPQLLSERRRHKGGIAVTTAAWADLDTCDPERLHLAPTITIESSPARYQALWVFDGDVDPDDAEQLSKRIAYEHSEDGADRSGWDLTQLLRVPYTYNYKYTTKPVVKIIDANRNRYRISDFKMYPEVPGYTSIDLPMPSVSDLSNGAIEELQKRRLSLNPMIWRLFQVEPESQKWSDALWKLELLLFEAGFDREAVFTIVREAKCNKYARDGKSEQMLWKDVCRAEAKHGEHIAAFLPGKTNDESLITDQERRDLEGTETFIERYITWARSLGDAAPQYHQAGAFIALSSLCAGTVRLPTSFGIMIPNLWFMILADTTLTRKTTAMDIAMDLIIEIDSDAILATDGSIEGLLTSLATRPGRPSVFLRDEFSGLLEQITKKDYYAGMAELLTKMYDGKMQKRILRKETIEVRDPCLIVFAGGIKDKVTSLLTFEHVSSGFIPRFVFITAESDVTKLKPLGPPTTWIDNNKEAIRNELRDLSKHYSATSQLVLTDIKQSPMTVRRTWDAQLTPEAWYRYNMIETTLLESGLATQRPEIMTPTFDRLAKSILKAGVLLAASRERGDEVIVEESDIVRAAMYGEQWRAHVVKVVASVGRGQAEKVLDRVLGSITRKPGIPRSTIMQHWHLSARDADTVLATLEQRNLITRQRQGRTEVLFPTQGGLL